MPIVERCDGVPPVFQAPGHAGAHSTDADETHADFTGHVAAPQRCGISGDDSLIQDLPQVVCLIPIGPSSRPSREFTLGGQNCAGSAARGRFRPVK